MNRQQQQDNACHILDLPRAYAIEIIAGLIELANESGAGRGFSIVIDDGKAKLEARKYPGDYYLEGYSQQAVTKIAAVVRGR